MLIFGLAFQGPGAAILALFREIPCATLAAQIFEKVNKDAGRITAIRGGLVSPAWLDEAMEYAGIVNV